MRKLSILAFALSILAVSCSKEMDNKVEPGQAEAGEFRVSATVSDATKASTVGATTTFVDKDMLSLYVWTGSNTAVPETPWINGEVNTYDGVNSKWVPTHQMRWQNVHDAHYFLGVYPAKAITNFTTDPFTLNPTTAAYEANDLLVATILGDGVKAENDFVTNTVPLTFDHLMAKLNLTIRFRDQWGGIPSSVTVTVKAATTGTINYLSKTITPGETKTLQPFNWEANALGAPTSYYTSLMIPQTFQEVNVTVGGQTYTYTHSTAIPLAAGTVTTLPLVVGKDFIALDDTGITVGDWTTTAIPKGMEPGSTALSGLNRPLTIRAIVDDTKVSFVNRSGGIVYYIKSNGEADIIGKSETAEISLNKDQNVRFLGDNASYGAAAKDQSSYFHFTKDCYVYGNVMSLVDSRNYATATTLTEDYAFAHLFDDCNGYIFNYAYDSIYLPATTLTKGCYQSMFQWCYSLTEVTILAPDISTATDCVKDWLTGVQGWVQDFQLVTPIPFAWKIGETLPEGSTVYTPVDDPEGGRTQIYKAPKCKSGLIYNTSAQELLVAGIPYVDGVSFEYSSDGTTWSSTVPSATNAGNYNVYCRVKDGGVTSKALAASIAKAAGSISYSTTTVDKTYGASAFTNTLTKTGDGTVTYSSNKATVASVNSTSGQVSVGNPGSATITATVTDGTNYTYATKTATYTVKVSYTKDFAYNGSVHTWKAPSTGSYDLEVWGAAGGNRVNESGGKGGYAKGRISLEAGTTLYIVVGGQGGSVSSYTGQPGPFSGGYNGGGKGGEGVEDYSGSAGGGGATHIAYSSFVISENGTQSYAGTNYIIVAGGGGGAGHGVTAPGDGGGNEGGRGTKARDGGSEYYSTYFYFDQNYSFGKPGSKGLKGDTSAEGSGGGGAGYWGGTTYEINPSWSNKNFHSAAGCGGNSSYNTNYSVTNWATTAGQQTGNGKAKITFIQ